MRPISTFALGLLSAVLALGYAWVIPSWDVPDESAHYLRAFEVSRGHLFNTASQDGIAIGCDEYTQLAFAPDGRPLVAYLTDVRPALGPNCTTSSRNTANLYSPIAYVFSGTGFAVADAFGIRDAQAKLTLGRMFNAILCTLLVFLWLPPPTRASLAILCLYYSPPVMSQMGSLSADAMTFAAAFRLALELERVHSDGRASAIRLGAIATVLSATKPTNSILGLAVASLLCRRPLGEGRWIAVACALAGTVVGTLMAIPLVEPYIAPGADPSAQLRGLLAQPLSIWSLAIETFKLELSGWLIQLGRPGPVPAMLTISMLVLTSTLILALTSPVVVALRTRLIVLTAVLLSVAAACASMYLVYSGVGAPAIRGIQSRYFLPALALVPLVVTGLVSGLPGWLRWTLFAVGPLCSAYVILRLLEVPRWAFVVPGL